MVQVQLDRSNATKATLDIMTIVDLEMKLLRHNTQTPAHIILAFLVRPGVSPASRALKSYNPNLGRAREYVKIAQLPSISAPVVVYLSESMKSVFTRALELAKQESTSVRPLVRTDQLLRAIIDEQDDDAQKLFHTLGINPLALKASLSRLSESDG